MKGARVISNNKCILIFKSHLIFVANPGGFSSKWAFTTKGDRGRQEVFTKQQQQPTTASQAGGTCTQEDAECNGSEFGEPSSDSGRCCIWLLAPEMMMTMSLQAILMAASDLGPGSFPSLDSEEGTLTKRPFWQWACFDLVIIPIYINKSDAMRSTPQAEQRNAGDDWYRKNSG